MKAYTYCVSKFCEFADEIPPAKIRHSQSGRIVRIIDWLTFVTIVQQPSGH